MSEGLAPEGPVGAVAADAELEAGTSVIAVAVSKARIEAVVRVIVRRVGRRRSVIRAAVGRVARHLRAIATVVAVLIVLQRDRLKGRRAVSRRDGHGVL